MKKILIFGNSGSGKSTLAKALSEQYELAHLDLDSLAWESGMPPIRKVLAESGQAINDFILQENSWVIEGCYTDLLEFAAPQAESIIFMNLPAEACQANARQRPWEPHKYASKEEQDANLKMLLTWIADYSEREDVFSLQAHQDFYDKFNGAKQMLRTNTQPDHLNS